jgi:hypothetical protein
MSIRRWTLVSALLTTLAAPGVAHAQSATPVVASAASPGGDDEVSLKNGGMVRGTVVSVEPGKEVAILVQGTGELRHLPWAEVDKVNRGKNAPVQPPASPLVPGVVPDGMLPAAPPLPPPLVPELGAPRIHIEASSPVTLHEATVTLDGWRRPIECQSPCDKIVDGRSGRAFFFAGDEIPESTRFLLSEKSGDVAVRVSPGNASARTAGTAMLATGIIGASVGAVLLPIGLAMNASRASTPPPGPGLGALETHASPLPLAGGIMLGAGAALVVTGIVMNVLGDTRYEFRNLTPGVIRF